MSTAVDIVVPIHNAADDLEACLASIVRCTRVPYGLVLVDDGSTDPRIKDVLRKAAAIAPHTVVVERAERRGFVRTVNEGIERSSGGDVVILNSDTIVSCRWLEKLQAAARRRPNVATVTPLTNNGTICSIPKPLVSNALPAGYDVEGFASLVDASSLRIYPEAPTGVGFCMLITRHALDTVGRFDAETFGEGYGEENDFCQRAIRAGLVNLIADDTFVFHKGAGSFGAESNARVARNLERVNQKHPHYAADVARFCEGHPLEPFHAILDDRIAADRGRQPAIATRVLHVLHHGGGTEKHARELAGVDDRGTLSYVLLSDGRVLDVEEYYGGAPIRRLRFPLTAPRGPHGPLSDRGYREAFVAICSTLDIDLVHVHHLMHNALDIADAAADLGVPFVMTLHDYHTVCPTYTLLDPSGASCVACTGGDGMPDACMSAFGQPASYVDEYQARMRRFLQRAARIFAPNPRVLDIVTARYPEIAAKATVVEHGHRRTVAAPRAAYDGGPLNVAVIGGIDAHKGSAVLRALLTENRRADRIFHLYGTTSDAEIASAPIGRPSRVGNSTLIHHGPYAAHDIVAMLRTDGIHVGLHLSIWPEAFSYTLSEFAEAGIPVIAGNLGAQGERVERCRLGWTVPDIRNPRLILELLDAIAQQPAMHRRAAAAMDMGAALPPIAAMWAHYLREYGAIAPPRRAEGSRSGYMGVLAARLAQNGNGPSTDDRMARLEHESATLRERLRSPRHRIAEVLGDALQRIPLVWPVVKAATEAFQRRKRSRDNL